MERAVVLLSGGVDSSTLLHHIRQTLGVQNVYAVSFTYGQKHAREIDMARRQAEAAGVADHHVIDIASFAGVAEGGSALTDASIHIPDLVDIAEEDREQPPTYVPNRNMTFLALAAAYAEARGITDIFYGAQAQDEYGYWDCTTDFLKKMNHVFALNRGEAITIHAPFVDLRKAEIVKMGVALGVDYAMTWTCYRGGDAPCGGCPSCVERAGAFREAGVEDSGGRAAAP